MRNRRRFMLLAALSTGLALGGCTSPVADPGAALAADATADISVDISADTSADVPAASPPPFVAVTFNTGTTGGLAHDEPPDDGYTSAMAAVSDQHYGDGLAWQPAVDATQAFFAQVAPDVVAFQEIFDSGLCPGVPAEARPGFVCATWQPGDPTVAAWVLGPAFQVACHPGKPDKCLAVRKTFGKFRGCDADFCLEGVAGFTVPGCGKGARVGRAVVDLTGGGELTVVNVHGSSGLTKDDQQCRIRQFEQVFVDLGDGQPAANGAHNLVLGDLNVDPGRWQAFEPSAQRFRQFAGTGKAFQFVTDLGEAATPTYGGVATIDHVVSDTLGGSCWSAGYTPGHAKVLDALYFDHAPVVCALAPR